MTEEQFIASLIEVSDVFKEFTPPCMDFREPDTLKPYRGLFRKNEWKAVFGTEADLEEACSVRFEGPEGV